MILYLLSFQSIGSILLIPEPFLCLYYCISLVISSTALIRSIPAFVYKCQYNTVSITVMLNSFFLLKSRASPYKDSIPSQCMSLFISLPNSYVSMFYSIDMLFLLPVMFIRINYRNAVQLTQVLRPHIHKTLYVVALRSQFTEYISSNIIRAIYRSWV